MKRLLYITALLVTLAALTGLALAEQVPVAPEAVEGKLMAVVVNSEGAKVFRDVYKEDADLVTPVETIAEGEEIDIRTMGLGWCRLRRDDKEMYYVRTADLSFSSEDFGNQIAVIFLKNSNKMPLHTEARVKSKKLINIPDGSYVAVQEKGETFSRVLYVNEKDGRVYDGYLQNTNLSFRRAIDTGLSRGYLRDPKKPERRTTVNLRSSNTAKGKKVKVLATRQYVTLLSVRDNGWVEVETDKGLHGYLVGDWVEIVESKAEAEPETDQDSAADETPGPSDEAEPADEGADEALPADEEDEAVTADDGELSPE